MGLYSFDLKQEGQPQQPQLWLVTLNIALTPEVYSSTGEPDPDPSQQMSRETKATGMTKAEASWALSMSSVLLDTASNQRFLTAAPCTSQGDFNCLFQTPLNSQVQRGISESPSELNAVPLC